MALDPEICIGFPLAKATPACKTPVPAPPVPFTVIVPSTVCTIEGPSNRAPTIKLTPLEDPFPIISIAPETVLTVELPNTKTPLVLSAVPSFPPVPESEIAPVPVVCKFPSTIKIPIKFNPAVIAVPAIILMFSSEVWTVALLLTVVPSAEFVLIVPVVATSDAIKSVSD